jgi:hypothetical protein
LFSGGCYVMLKERAFREKTGAKAIDHKTRNIGGNAS